MESSKKIKKGHIEDYISNATQVALNLKEDKVNKGVINGYASLDSQGKVPTTQLPVLASLEQNTVLINASNNPTLNNNINNVLLFQNTRTYTLPNTPIDYNFNAIVYPGVTINLALAVGLTSVFAMPATVTAGQIFTVMKIDANIILRGI